MQVALNEIIISMFINKVLITGGTGTIGTELARQMTASEITIFSRNEKNQVEMKAQYPYYKYIIGDVRDESEITKACTDMDYVFHFAALKHVNICEEQPQEAIKTNIIGTLNVINACKRNKCRLINMSSDKAINPVNVYGMTKAIGEKMVNQAGYVNIRSGNVLWSSGSVLMLWKDQLEKENCINITSREITRFFIHPTKLAFFIKDKMDYDGGTFIVSMKSFRLYDIAERFIRIFGNKESVINVTQLRPGERLHEYRDEYISSETDICTDLNYIFQ